MSNGRANNKYNKSCRFNLHHFKHDRKTNHYPIEDTPFNYSQWEKKERFYIHHYTIRRAKELASKFPFFEPSDLFNAGYIGYSKAIKYMTWTIHNHGLNYIRIAINSEMIREIWSIYGRPTFKETGYVGKGDRQNFALRHGTVSLEGPPLNKDTLNEEIEARAPWAEKGEE